MGYTSDNVPGGNPFSQQYKDFVAGMARDITDLMRYKAMFDQMSLDVLGSGGGGGGSEVFPAAITGFEGSFTSDPLGVAYEFEEVIHPKTTDALAGGRTSIGYGDIKEGQVFTAAYNTLEVGLVDNTGSGEATSYIPPGLRGECFQNAAPGPGDQSIQFFVSKISSAPKTVVMLTHFGLVETFPDNFVDVYYFSCPVALCAGCEGENGGFANAEQQQEELRNTIVTPESVTRPMQDITDEEASRRGFFRNRRYRK